MVRTLINLLSTLALLVWTPTQAISLFACEPEWTALAKVLLPAATVHTASNYGQDPHHIEAKPSLIAHLRRADFVICTGAELEAGWLPMLQDKAANPKAQNGQPSMFYAAEHVSLLNPFKGVIHPFSGDVHAQGNPHIHADPRRLLQVAQALAKQLGQVFPDQQSLISHNFHQFSNALQASMQVWEKQSLAIKGQELITQHTAFAYLLDWLGLEPILDLEPKPGMPPTPNHLNTILSQSQLQQPLGIVIAQHQDPKPARWLAQHLNMSDKLLVLPATVVDDQPGSINRWFDHLVTQLSALPPRKP